MGMSPHEPGTIGRFVRSRFRHIIGTIVVVKLSLIFMVLMEQTASRLIVTNKSSDPLTIKYAYVDTDGGNHDASALANSASAILVRDCIVAPKSHVILTYRNHQGMILHASVGNLNTNPQFSTLFEWGYTVAIEAENNTAVNTGISLRREPSTLRLWLERNRSWIPITGVGTPLQGQAE